MSAGSSTPSGRTNFWELPEAEQLKTLRTLHAMAEKALETAAAQSVARMRAGAAQPVPSDSEPVKADPMATEVGSRTDQA
ncbi:hypothetical protein K678_16425 [Magnetospirillum fulvum MGU-K5]|uniref:Uncharacterized protein n=1 Tax=Magnetospirillum fulvum MGU-K5 TaxID=1316936 RepID=S9S319_MAGFU|nr:hypothetical protein K678_16425 [Magnetospirillum fulvum MGU-K5]